MRDYNLYLQDILDSALKIKKYCNGLNYRSFCKDDKTIDAVIRNFEIIGEAAKRVPNKIKLAYPDLDWEGMAGMRNILAHEYFGIKLEIIWKTISNKVPELLKKIKIKK